MLENYLSGAPGIGLLSGLLFAVGAMLLATEAVSPGLGLGGAVGLMMQLACFAPDVVSGSVPWGVLLLAALGCALMLLDSNIAGFGPLAALGLALLLVALWVTADGAGQFFYTLSASAVLIGAALPVALHRLPSTRMMQRIRLDDTLSDAASPRRELPAPGTPARTFCDLKPRGVICVGDERYPACAESFIEKDTPVRVVGKQGDALLVERADR